MGRDNSHHVQYKTCRIHQFWHEYIRLQQRNALGHDGRVAVRGLAPQLLSHLPALEPTPPATAPVRVSAITEGNNQAGQLKGKAKTCNHFRALHPYSIQQGMRMESARPLRCPVTAIAFCFTRPREGWQRLHERTRDRWKGLCGDLDTVVTIEGWIAQNTSKGGRPTCGARSPWSSPSRWIRCGCGSRSPAKGARGVRGREDPRSVGGRE
jgi:hypothetical protein